MLREDDDTISQDESGLLHAHTLFRFLSEENVEEEDVEWQEFRSWQEFIDTRFTFDDQRDFDLIHEAILDGIITEQEAESTHYDLVDKSVSKSSIFSREWHQNKRVREEAESIDNECSSCIVDCIKEQVWPEDLNKAPSWESDDDVTQQTQQWMETVLDMRDPLWNDYADIPETAGMRVHQVIKDSLTQPQGWSLDSVVNQLADEFDFLPKHRVERIVRQEVAATLNEAEIVELQARPEEPTVKWVGPDDQDTTVICQEIKSEIGSGVPLSEALDVLSEKAAEYEDDGGTPDRAEQGVPHFLCRHTLSVVDD